MEKISFGLMTRVLYVFDLETKCYACNIENIGGGSILLCGQYSSAWTEKLIRVEGKCQCSVHILHTEYTVYSIYSLYA